MNKIIVADALQGLAEIGRESVNMCVTSPPYFGLRDYGVAGQIGLEETPEEYIEKLACVFREVRRALKPDGTLWVNIGDSHAGSGKGGQSNRMKSENWQPEYVSHGKKYGLKNKDLIGIPWLLAFALRADGWYLRQDIIWNKPSVMPESVTDRCTKSHEYLFLLSKSARYYFDNAAIKEPATSTDTSVRNRDETRLNNTPGRTHMNGLTKNNYTMRNKRDVWTIPTRPNTEAHFAAYPPDLIKPCILAGSRKGDIVLDPFMGSGTTAVVALESERQYLGIELNPQYAEIAERRISRTIVQLSLF